MAQAKKVSHRQVGKTLGDVVPAVRQLLHNEALIIEKLAALEAESAQSSAFREMTLWQRAVWLVRGMA